LLRRLEKRIIVPLPSLAARRTILASLLAGRCLPAAPQSKSSTGSGSGVHPNNNPSNPAGTAAPGGDGDPVDLDWLARSTEGYTGSDIAVLAKEAAMRPLRRLIQVLEPRVFGSDQSGGASTLPAAAAATANGSGSSSGSSKRSAAAGGGDVMKLLGPVTQADVAVALKATKATGGRHAAEFEVFSKQYGQI
jgi:SpoVK/Ycf46/Vps4 family AAA+-type ATPase